MFGFFCSCPETPKLSQAKMNRVAFLFCSCFPDFFFSPLLKSSNLETQRPRSTLTSWSFGTDPGRLWGGRAPSPHGSQWDSPGRGYFSAHLCSLFHRRKHRGQQRGLQSPGRKGGWGYTNRRPGLCAGMAGCGPLDPSPLILFLASSSSTRALWRPPAHPSL